MTSSEFAGNLDNFCYRHPDRQSFVLCQRCTRTICPECMTQAPVGVVCPECMKEQRKGESPAQRKARRRWGSGGAAAVASDQRPMVTYAIIAITAFVGLLQMVPGLNITRWLQFAGLFLYPDLNGGYFEPWRLLTAVFVHGGIPHFALNMLALWMIGRTLEPMLGRWRFLALYLIGGLGGSVFVALWDPLQGTVGASGAVFALFGALLIIGRHMGANVSGILVILGINLVIGFIPGFRIAWQAHIGGAIVGALIGLILVKTRRRDQALVRNLLLAALAVVLLVVVFLVPPLIHT